MGYAPFFWCRMVLKVFLCFAKGTCCVWILVFLGSKSQARKVNPSLENSPEPAGRFTATKFNSSSWCFYVRLWGGIHFSKSREVLFFRVQSKSLLKNVGYFFWGEAPGGGGADRKIPCSKFFSRSSSEPREQCYVFWRRPFENFEVWNHRLEIFLDPSSNAH